MLNQKVKEYLDAIDANLSPLTHNPIRSIRTSLQNFYREMIDIGIPFSVEDTAENYAFSFIPDYTYKIASQDDNAKHYYNPFWVDAGFKYPNPKDITDKILTYWETRSKICKNPILYAHYADLVIDFHRTLRKGKADNSFFHQVIDGYIAIVTAIELEESSILYGINIIKRALDLASFTHDKERLSTLAEIIISFEKRYNQYEAILGIAFQWLVLENDLATPEQTEYLLTSLYAQINNNTDTVDIARMGRVSTLLASYYAKNKDRDNLYQTLSTLEKTIKNAPFLSGGSRTYHEKLKKLYKAYNFKSDYKRLVKEISIVRRKGFTLMPTTLFTYLNDTQLKKQEISTTYPIENFLTQLTHDFMYVPKDTYENLDDLPFFAHMATMERRDGDGRVIVYTNFNKNPTQYAIWEAHDELLKIAPHLNNTTRRIKLQFQPDAMVDYLVSTKIFKDEYKPYIQEAIQHYWDNNYLVASHLFVPLIESGLRAFILNHDGHVEIENDDNGNNVKTLGQLLSLSDEDNKRIFADMLDIHWYMKTVLIENMGLNIRNKIAHGLEKNMQFTPHMADRLFHILVLMSFF